jgi:aminopeptidase N
MSKKVVRLYEQFQPEHYNVSLNLDREAMRFSGAVTVRGKKTGRPSQRITFHQKGLKVSSAKIVKHDKKEDKELTVERINNQNSFDEVRLHGTEMIYPGEYTVIMEFEGEITRPMHGIYPCYYMHNGEKKLLLATQFESHHAREAFPCIDEPEAKATFDLTLNTPPETVLANTPIKDQKKDGDRQVTSFETSPKMSTYLLAFATGEMHGVTGKTKDGIEVRSWATVAQPKDHLNYANDEAIRVLEFFTDYFQTPFPLKKLDQVALPDFESLAMENWGLITYREVGLLADPKNRSLSGEQLITLVIAHEISHQWFGNLVTMKWWDDLWLNESFASIMENIAPDALHPDWQQWEDFATSRALAASQRDSFKDVQSVSVEVNHPDEIMTLFDPAIVYAKGARLLTMMRDYIGEDAFRKGLKSYFKKYAYSNTTRNDLWTELSQAAGKDIGKIMTPWIKQSGQPLLTVSQNGDKIILEQRRFLLDGEDDSLWPIPLLADQDLSPDLMPGKTMKLPYDGAMPVFNAHGSGHYIVDYGDKEIWKSLHEKIASGSIDALGRINILNDMLQLVRAEKHDLIDILELVSACSKEPRAAVWTMFMRALGQVQTLIDEDEVAEERLRAYRKELASYWYDKLGWEDKPADDPNTMHLRTTALALSIGGENQAAIDHALKMFEKAGSAENIPAEQRAMVAGATVRFGPPKYIEQLKSEYSSTPNADLQESIAAALASTRKAAVAEDLIHWGLHKDGAVRPQDMGHWFAYFMRNHYTRDAAWQWVTKNWDELVELFGGGKYMEYFIWYSAGPVSTPKDQARFKKFFEPKMSEPSSKRNIQIALSEIEVRVAWRDRHEKAIKTWLSDIDPA